MKIGCHAVLFTKDIAEKTEEVISNVARIGFDGMEVGSRFFGNSQNVYLKNTMNHFQMELAGFHKAISLIELLNNVEKVEEELAETAEFVSIMENKNIILTGMVPDVHAADFGEPRLADAEEVKMIAIQLNRISEKLFATYGVYVNYHNHNWEFSNDALIFNALLEHAPKLHFALDIGWVYVEGYDPVKYLIGYEDRFNYLHLRDYLKSNLSKYTTFTEKHQHAFVDIGEGDADFETIFKVFQKQGGDVEKFAVIEYEMGEVSYERYANAYRTIQKVLNS